MGWGVAEASQTTYKFPRKTNAADFALQRRATAGFTTRYMTDTLPLAERWPGPRTQARGARGELKQVVQPECCPPAVSRGCPLGGSQLGEAGGSPGASAMRAGSLQSQEL